MAVIKRICQFCGKDRRVNVYTHGDNDEDGRSYGIYTTDDDKGCDCILGQAMFQHFI